MSHYGIPAGSICFEITETTLVSNFERAESLVNQLRELGCGLALDDFGSGLSSFAYLKKFEVDYLKIDGSLIREIVENDSDRKMVAALASMAEKMGMKTIAEFVENQAIIEVLADLGVDFLQGYGVSKPVPLTQVLTPQLMSV